MGGISFWHILVVVVVVAAVFGHREIPALFGAIGRLVGAIRRAARPKPRPGDDMTIEGTFKRRDD